MCHQNSYEYDRVIICRIHATDGIGQTNGVFAYQFVGAYGDGLLVLCVAIERDTGHMVESGLLCHIARRR